MRNLHDVMLAINAITHDVIGNLHTAMEFYERYQSRLARLYGFINGGFRLQVEGGARGASAQGALGLLGLLDLWARRILGHHQVAF